MKRDETADSKPKFENVLGTLILAAHDMMGESKTQPAAASNGDPGAEVAPRTDASPQRHLRQMLESLDPEMAFKVRALMIAGRDGKDLSSMQHEGTLGDSVAALATAARDASENGPLLAEYLRRGHAIACAAGIDLERPIASWGATTAATLDERAWRSFGRQLAGSDPDDWQFLGCVEPGGQEIVRLYVRLRDNAWWSFQSVLERPSSVSVSKETRALASRRSKGVMASSLKTLVARLDGAPAASGKGAEARSSKPAKTQGRALRRAARAIRARVGQQTAP